MWEEEFKWEKVRPLTFKVNSVVGGRLTARTAQWSWYYACQVWFINLSQTFGELIPSSRANSFHRGKSITKCLVCLGGFLLLFSLWVCRDKETLVCVPPGTFLYDESIPKAEVTYLRHSINACWHQIELHWFRGLDSFLFSYHNTSFPYEYELGCPSSAPRTEGFYRIWKKNLAWQNLDWQLWISSQHFQSVEVALIHILQSLGPWCSIMLGCIPQAGLLCYRFARYSARRSRHITLSRWKCKQCAYTQNKYTK